MPSRTRSYPNWWVGAAVCLTGTVGAVLASPAPRDTDARSGMVLRAPYRHLAMFGEAFHAVRTRAADPPADGQLVEAAIAAMVASLDPYSRYLTAAEFRRLDEAESGSYSGVGIEVEAGGKIISTLPGSPAARAGLALGTVIERIDGVAVAHLGRSETVGRLRGEPGSTVRLRLMRPGERAPVALALTREWLPLHPVRVRVLGTVAYIGLDRFDDFTLGRVLKSVAILKADIGPDRLSGLILDLRGNPGGLVVQAVAVAGALLGRGEIVRLVGRRPDEVERFAPDRTGAGVVDGVPMVVLVNGDTASAAEIVAGALQDHRRATVIGTRTYGKGAVQTTYGHRGGHWLRLTTAWVVTPAGRKLEGNGIEPDSVVLQEGVPGNGEINAGAPLSRPVGGVGSLQEGIVVDVRSAPIHDWQLLAGLLHLGGSATTVAEMREACAQEFDLPQGSSPRSAGECPMRSGPGPHQPRSGALP